MDFLWQYLHYFLSPKLQNLLESTFAAAECDTVCPKCGRQYRDRKTMKRHLRIHLGIKNFKCWLCQFSAARKDSLKSHCFRKHKLTETEFQDGFRMGISYGQGEEYQ